jgi:NitT/TauT family transport system permease protein
MKAHLVNLLKQVGPPLIAFAFFGLSWHALVEVFDLPPYLLPGPPRVVDAVSTHAARLIDATLLTAMGALSGFALSLAFGFIVALLFSQSRLIERGLYPYAIFLQTVPIVAIAPLIVLWIGYGLQGVVAVSFIISLFPIIANTTAGLTQIDPTPCLRC